MGRHSRSPPQARWAPRLRGGPSGTIGGMCSFRSERPALSGWQRLALTGWLLLALAGLAWYATHADAWTPRQLAETLASWRGPLALLYVVVLVARAFVLIPSTPLVLAGVLLFPESPGLLLCLSLVGIGLSATLLYFCAERLGLDLVLRRRYPRQFAQVAAALDSRWGPWLLVAWAFFPAVPTDLACHVAGMVRMPFPRFLAAVLLGELILCGVCIVLGQRLLG